MGSHDECFSPWSCSFWVHHESVESSQLSLLLILVLPGRLRPAVAELPARIWSRRGSAIIFLPQGRLKSSVIFASPVTPRGNHLAMESCVKEETGIFRILLEGNQRSLPFPGRQAPDTCFRIYRSSSRLGRRPRNISQRPRFCIYEN